MRPGSMSRALATYSSKEFLRTCSLKVVVSNPESEGAVEAAGSEAEAEGSNI